MRITALQDPTGGLWIRSDMGGRYSRIMGSGNLSDPVGEQELHDLVPDLVPVWVDVTVTRVGESKGAGA